MSDVIVVCGPTASGKSAYAMRLASEIGGVIINADSCQLYKELPILTSSPSDKDKRDVPHYLYNYLNLEDSFSVVKYYNAVSVILDGIKRKGLTPIVVGGSGMYIQALLCGISEIPDVESEIRELSRKKFKELGKLEFYKILSSVDSKIVGRILPTDSQRMLRAYEVFVQTGRSITDYWSSKNGGVCGDAKVIMLNPAREILYDTCNRRFESFINQGALDEVANVIPRLEEIKCKALGLRQLADYLLGRTSLEMAIREAQAKTRQYAKRQVTWFNHQIKNKVVTEC